MKEEELLPIWQNLNQQYAEIRALQEVVNALAVKHPDLNQVMESLLSRRDEIMAGLPSDQSRKNYAECLDRWHIRLLHAQRVEGKDR
jgi:hypothetical protein